MATKRPVLAELVEAGAASGGISTRTTPLFETRWNRWF